MATITGRDRFLMEKLAKHLHNSLRFPTEATDLRREDRGVSFDVRLFVDKEPTGHIARVTVELLEIEDVKR